MKGFEKYQKSYFMPPVDCYDWVKKDSIEEAPIWCSVDLRDGNQAQQLVLSPGTFGGYVVDDIGYWWISGQVYTRSIPVSNSNYVMKFSEHKCYMGCTWENCSNEDSKLSSFH